MCSFTVLGGSENQSVSVMTTICLTQCNKSPSHRVDQVIDCGLWNVGPLLFNGCAKLLDIARNWNTLSYMPIKSIPNMLNGDMSSEYPGYARTGMFSASWKCVQILVTWGRALSCCNTMVVDEWHNNGPQDIVTVSLCIQNAINKMHMCSLSITYACP